MKIIDKANFLTVLSVFDREHPTSEGTNSWARKMLENANHEFNGEWHQVQLSRKDILGILLVGHHDPMDGLVLIPEQGMSVRMVAKHWKDIKSIYQVKNKDCYAKITKFSEQPFSAIFLSVRPIKGYDVPEYENLEYKNNALVHLDGLHRLVAWAIAGRFNRFRYFLGRKLNAFIAGPI